MPCATIKYSSAGLPIWTNRYSGPGNGTARPSAVAVDASNNVLVTGTDWVFGSYDFATVKYSPAGVPLWTNYYNGPGNDSDSPNAMAVDTFGSVIVAGYSTGTGSSWDYTVIKYSTTGVPLWTNRYDGPDKQMDSINALAVDENGNVFVTGDSAGSGYFPENTDFTTIKYSSAGVPLWTNRFNGPGNNSDTAFAIALDKNGNVVVTGASRDNSTGNDYATIKYSGAGVPLWTNRYDGLGSGHDYPVAVALPSNGNVFVTGFSYDESGFSHFATVAYSGEGDRLWTNRYDGPKGGHAHATALALREQTVIVTGISSDASGAFEYVTIGYSWAGVPAWTNRLTAVLESSTLLPKVAKAVEAPSGTLAITPDGYVLAGTAVRGTQGNDYLLVKYTHPVTLQATLGSGGLEVSWPSSHLGWRLEVNTQPGGTGLSNQWTTVPGSTLTNRMTIPFPPSPSFLRLAYP